MAPFTWSLKVKASIAAAALFLAGLATAGALSYVAMSTVVEQSHENQTSRAVEEALETLKEVRTRMAGYASILARHPDLVATVKSKDAAMLEAFFVREFRP